MLRLIWLSGFWLGGTRIRYLSLWVFLRTFWREPSFFLKEPRLDLCSMSVVDICVSFILEWLRLGLDYFFFLVWRRVSIFFSSYFNFYSILRMSCLLLGSVSWGWAEDCRRVGLLVGFSLLLEMEGLSSESYRAYILPLRCLNNFLLWE